MCVRKLYSCYYMALLKLYCLFEERGKEGGTRRERGREKERERRREGWREGERKSRRERSREGEWEG